MKHAPTSKAIDNSSNEQRCAIRRHFKPILDVFLGPRCNRPKVAKIYSSEPYCSEMIDLCHICNCTNRQLPTGWSKQMRIFGSRMTNQLSSNGRLSPSVRFVPIVLASFLTVDKSKQSVPGRCSFKDCYSRSEAHLRKQRAPLDLVGQDERISWQCAGRPHRGIWNVRLNLQQV